MERTEAVKALGEALTITENKAGLLYDAGYTDVEKLKGVTLEQIIAVPGIGKDVAGTIVATVSGESGASGSSDEGAGISAPSKKDKKDAPEDAPKCFGKYPTKKDPGKKCRTCKFHRICKA